MRYETNYEVIKFQWNLTLISDDLDYNVLVLLLSTLPIGVHTYQLISYDCYKGFFKVKMISLIMFGVLRH